jgi:AraC-like DNA-binding protein
MNKIYWDRDKISIITDQIEAVPHKHWAMQLFLSVEKEFEISVGKQQISCRCIIINRNTPHSFSTGNILHFTMIIEPTTSIAGQLDKIMKGKEYHIFDNPDIVQTQEILFRLIHSNGMEEYQHFMIQLYKFLRLKEHSKIYDDRIRELLHEIEQCNCDTHSIASFADKAALSPSRLSHLFREQVGIPLKSYLQFHQMKKAFLALLNGKNITEAAMFANFGTPSHFAAVTKKMMGMPASISLKNSVFLKVTEGETGYN